MYFLCFPLPVCELPVFLGEQMKYEEKEEVTISVLYIKFERVDMYLKCEL